MRIEPTAEPSSRGLVFLDFDGVLHPIKVGGKRLVKLPVFEHWLQARPSIDLVFSTSWREQHSVEALAAFLSPDLRHRCLGATPMLHRVFGPTWSRTPEEVHFGRYERQAEIELWFKEHPANGAWAAVDDMPELFEPECSWLVTCDASVGLTSLDLNRLDQMLGLAKGP